MHTGRSWLCPLAAALTVARNWVSSSGKLAMYSSFIMHIYSGLYQRLERCSPKEEWALTSDHIPIQIQLDLDIKAQPNGKRYAIRKLNIDSFLNIIKQQL